MIVPKDSRSKDLASKVIFAAPQILHEKGGEAPGREVVANSSTEQMTPRQKLDDQNEKISLMSSLSKLAPHAPRWFIGATGIVYLTGFLVFTEHLGRIGITDIGGDLFRLKYIEVGLIYLLPYVALLIPTLLWIRMSEMAINSLADQHRSPRDEIRCRYCKLFEDKKPQSNMAPQCIECHKSFNSRARYHRFRQAFTGWTLTIYVLTLILVLYFAPDGFVKKQLYALVTLSGPIIFLFVVVLTDPKNIQRRRRALAFRALMLFATCCTSVWILWQPGIADILQEVLSMPGTIIYVVLIGVMGLSFATFSLKRGQMPARLNIPLLLVCSSMLLVLFYLNILSFTAGIYPYIPFHRSGADYTQTPNVTLWFRDNYKPNGQIASIPAELCDKGLQSKTLKIIYESPMWLYVADPTENGGPEHWRRGFWPPIHGVRRESIAAIYLKTTN